VCLGPPERAGQLLSLLGVKVAKCHNADGPAVVNRLLKQCAAACRAAKAVCLGPPERAAQLLALLGGRRPRSPLTVLAAVEALAAVAADPGARTTEGLMLRQLLTEAAAIGRPLFALFNHPAGALLVRPT